MGKNVLAAMKDLDLPRHKIFFKRNENRTRNFLVEIHLAAFRIADYDAI